MTVEHISTTVNFPSNFIEIEGSKMHFIEAGKGDPILFLHGIPTSSYLWRNIIPHLATLGRCICPDLLGFGLSDKPQLKSTFDHLHYIDAFIQKLHLKNITIVMHGFGAVIGSQYAMMNERNCKGLVFYEAFLRHLNGVDASLPFQHQLESLQLLDVPENTAIENTDIISQLMPQLILRELSSDEMKQYQQPFMDKNSNAALLQYLRTLKNPEQSKVLDSYIVSYTNWLTNSQLPKLLLYSLPGFITSIATVMWAKKHFPHLEIVEIGEELHLAQESYPRRMGEIISAWLQSIEQR
jgi:haloalkane dehalogenase